MLFCAAGARAGQRARLLAALRTQRRYSRRPRGPARPCTCGVVPLDHSLFVERGSRCGKPARFRQPWGALARRWSLVHGQADRIGAHACLVSRRKARVWPADLVGHSQPDPPHPRGCWAPRRARRGRNARRDREGRPPPQRDPLRRTARRSPSPTAARATTSSTASARRDDRRVTARHALGERDRPAPPTAPDLREYPPRRSLHWRVRRTCSALATDHRRAIPGAGSSESASRPILARPRPGRRSTSVELSRISAHWCSRAGRLRCCRISSGARPRP